jgi:hypothetical protein
VDDAAVVVGASALVSATATLPSIVVLILIAIVVGLVRVAKRRSAE